jgi:hypothetical protein
MLTDDLTKFMACFLGFLGMFYVSLYLLYPRTGSHLLPHVPAFNSYHKGLFALLDLSFMGERVDFSLFEDSTFEVMSGMQVGNLFLWLALYYTFTIVSLILLINLLIAMMSHSE